MQSFTELPQAKQKKILNAGMELFGKYGYKHANTEDIARLAGISKGLLFYYFKNKQTFYVYIFDYCEQLVNDFIQVDNVDKIDDFFELMDFGANQKVKLLKEYPYCMDFVLSAWFSTQAGDVNILAQRMESITRNTYTTWFSRMNIARFKEGVDPNQVYQMLTWMMEGYLYERKLMKQPLVIENMMDEFHKWAMMFKQFTYKEEYL